MISDRKLITLIDTGQLMECENVLMAIQHLKTPIHLIVVYSIALEEIQLELKARKTKKDCKEASPNSPIKSKHI